MATFSPYKVVSALPTPLEPDSVYYVRVGTGVDMYVTNSSGTISAYTLNVAQEILNKADKTVATTSANGLMSAADKLKLDGIQAGAQVNTVTSVAGKTGAVALAKGDVGLGNVDNTSDANKPISTATQSALDGKLNITGGTLTGPLTITPPANTAPIRVSVNHLGDIPTNVSYGDMFVHMNKLYVRGYTASFTLGGTGDLSAVTQATAEEGTTTSLYVWSPLRVRQNVLAAPIVKQGGSTSLEMNHVTGTGITLKAGSTDYGATWPINITGNANAATNSTQLNGQAASYYTNIPARLGYSPVREGSSHTITLSWLGSTLGLQVNTTNFSNNWPINITGTAGAVSNAAVHNATAASAAGGVGSYLMLKNFGTNAQVVQGTIVAGSSLRFTSAAGSDGSGTVDGSWRCMGYINTGETSPSQRTTLFLRVS